ncbi:exosortase/archaeosortase family protein [Chloroflexota bacterium]
MKNIRINMIPGSVTVRLGLWLALSLAVSLVFFQEFWASLGRMISPDWVFGQHHAAPWGVLGLCVIWLWLKRREMGLGAGFKGAGLRASLSRYSPGVALGIGLIAGAVLMPVTDAYMVFQVLLASLGVFVIIFGRAAVIPAILLAIYGMAVSFPLIIERFAEGPYSAGAIAPMMWVMTTIGYPLQNSGQLVSFTSAGGDSISVAITAACAGPATMGVFLAIFALMMLDIPLSPKKAALVFLFGLVGTWLQSIFRLIILMLVGYHLGASAMWTAHSWTIYILFPLWYLLFVIIYFRQAGSSPRTGSRIGDSVGRAFGSWKDGIEGKGKTAVRRISLLAVSLAVAAMLFIGVDIANAQTGDSYRQADRTTRSDTYTGSNAVSAVIAAIGVGGLCSGIHYLKRRQGLTGLALANSAAGNL